MNGSDRAEAPLTSVGLSRLIANRNELKAFIKTAFTLPSGGRISDQYLARLMPNILAILEPHGTLCVSLSIAVKVSPNIARGTVDTIHHCARIPAVVFLSIVARLFRGVVLYACFSCLC